MSAIAGIVQFDGAPVPAEQIEAMTDAMPGRGRDGTSHWVTNSIALGQCMLRTTPEALEETQPLASEDQSLVLVMDGRVDDRDQLRRDLIGRGAVLRDHTDAELVLRAYEVWGEHCAERIIGEFAFFVWDARNRRLFGARDAAGTRHFYYHAARGWFGFASEIRGLLALGRIEQRLNESRLLDYLVAEYDRDDETGTFYQNILRLPAGHSMLVTESGVRTWRYWEPGNLSPNRFASLDECAEAFREQLKIAVQCRLRSIGPVGAMLSGGLDSSAIVGLIRNEFPNELNQPLKTFSLIREDRENCADWNSIQEMLKGGWIDSTLIDSNIAPGIIDAQLGNIALLNEPFSLSEGFPNSLVYEAATEGGCDVVMDGMAADLFFYDPERSFERIMKTRTFAMIPAILNAGRRHSVGQGVRAMSRRMVSAAANKRLLATYRKIRDRWNPPDAEPKESPGDILRHMHKAVADRFMATKVAGRARVEEDLDAGDELRAHARYFTSGMLSFAHEVNGQIALARGVEPRSPFSDRRMLEFAIRMPIEAKLSAGWYKHLLRRSMAGVLPETVRWRRDIGSHPGWKFHERLTGQMSRDGRDFWNIDRLASTLAEWIDASSLNRLREKYEASRDYGAGFNLFALTVLAHWLTNRGLNQSR